MILKLVAPGLAAAGLLAAGIFAAQAEPAKAPEKAPAAAESGRKVVKLRVLRTGEAGADETETTEIVIDGEKIAREVEVTVGEAVSDAMKALENLDREIAVEVDGKQLEALGEKQRKTLEKVRERLKGMSERLAEKSAEIEVRVAKVARDAGKTAKKAGESLREQRVIILRDRAGDAKVEIDTDRDGRTVVIIKGGDVKVVTGGKGTPDKGAPGKTPK